MSENKEQEISLVSKVNLIDVDDVGGACLLYTSPSPRDDT